MVSGLLLRLTRMLGHAKSRVAAKTKGMDQSVLMQFLKKLPRRPTTGNFVIDESIREDHEALIFILETLIADPSHCGPMTGHLRHRLRALQDLPANSSLCYQGPITTISSLPEEFRSQFICNNKKLVSQDLVKVLKFDNEATNDILEYLLQLPRTFRLSADC